jgi:hypothetical protein
VTPRSHRAVHSARPGGGTGESGPARDREPRLVSTDGRRLALAWTGAAAPGARRGAAAP